MMNEKNISQICLGITILGILIFLLTYQNEFEEKTSFELLSKDNSKGILFGRVEYVIRNYPTTLFVLNDGNETTIYYPKATTLAKGTFVQVYAENKTDPPDSITTQKNKKQRELYAQKVIEK